MSVPDPFYDPPVQAGQGHDDLPPDFAAHIRPSVSQHCGEEGKFSWRMDCETTENFGITRMRGDRPWTLVPSPVSHALMIAFPLQGSLEATVREDSITARPGQALLLSTPDVKQVKVQPDPLHSHVVMTFPTAAISGIYDSEFKNIADNVVENRVVDLDTPLGANLYHLTKAVSADLFGMKYFKKSAEASRLISNIVLNIIIQDSSQFAIDSSIDYGAPYVCRAVRFIHDQLHQPMTISTIAEAAGVSARSLQSGFKRIYGMTPMAYLQRARLEFVHAELSNPGNFLPVGEVAAKWGFTHFGRFSALYRAQFGVNPSVTSRKRR